MKVKTTTLRRWTCVGALAAMWAATAALPSPNLSIDLAAQSPQAAQAKTRATIQEKDLREWLTYLASDELQGRQLFTEGYGNATQYVAERLREMGVKPMGDNGTYFQIVKQKGYRIIN